jgi:hypothetical protein
MITQKHTIEGRGLFSGKLNLNGTKFNFILINFVRIQSVVGASLAPSRHAKVHPPRNESLSSCQVVLKITINDRKIIWVWNFVAQIKGGT